MALVTLQAVLCGIKFIAYIFNVSTLQLVVHEVALAADFVVWIEGGVTHKLV